MKLTNIKIFLQNTESLLIELGFTVKEYDDFYLCSYNGRECSVLPFVDKITEIDFKKIKKYKNPIILHENNNYPRGFYLKEISLNDIKTILKFKSKHREMYDKILDYIFFDSNISDLLDILTKEKNKTNNQKKEISKVKKHKIVSKKIDKNKISIIEDYLKIVLIKDRKYYHDGKENAVIALISKYYDKRKEYWYGYHDYQINILNNYKNSYIALYFNDRNDVLLIPFKTIEKYRSNLNTTIKKDGKQYWHIHIYPKNEHFLWKVPNYGFIDVTDYAINTEIKKGKLTKIEYFDNEPVIKIKSLGFVEKKVGKKRGI